MPRIKNIIGQKFNWLTVIEDTGRNNSKRYRLWRCKCKCGSIVERSIASLKSKDFQSCGCHKNELLKGKEPVNKLDLVGQKFGKLEVIKKINSINYKSNFLCKCDCGNEIEVLGTLLYTNSTMSCGCSKSKGELKIIEILQKNNFNYKYQYKINNWFFDFAILDYLQNIKYLIEYDGIQHFIQNKNIGWNSEEQFLLTQRRDKEKNEYCKNNNIILIRIPYTNFKHLKLDDLQLETSNFIWGNK